jgi:hypothetical protein
MTKQQEPIFNLDSEEQDLSDSFDRHEWETVSNLKDEIERAKIAAANYLRKLTYNQ